MTSVRSRMLSGVSGGGSFFLDAIETAFAGAFSFSSSILESLATDGGPAEASAGADMLVLLMVAFVRGWVD
jgi:hypothetical protein